MKIAITHPATFSRIRRGTERFVHELAVYLARKGHEVRVIASKPGPRVAQLKNGYIEDCHRRLWHPSLARFGVIEAHAFLLTTLRELIRNRYDIVQCCSFTDAFAAGIAERYTHTPYVFLVNGLPPRIRYYRSLTLHGAVFHQAIHWAAEIIAISDYVQQYLDKRFRRSGVRIPVPVNTDIFKLSKGSTKERPIILCAAALDDRRKGGRVLLRAFNQLKERRPDVVLQISSAIPDSVREQLLELVDVRWRHDVYFLGAGRVEDLPKLFGQASITVLPSVWEPFGMVILESMATGTPVVGTRDGAIPELINNERVGRLFDPGPSAAVEPTNAEGLMHAMLQGLELSQKPETAVHCREHAEGFGWERIGPRFEDIYSMVQQHARSSRKKVATALAETKHANLD